MIIFNYLLIVDCVAVALCNFVVIVVIALIKMVLSRAQIAEFEGVLMEAFKKESFIQAISTSISDIVGKRINDIIAKYETKMMEFQTGMDVLKTENATLKKQCNLKVDFLEQYSRRNNIRIFGIPENGKESVELLVMDMISTKLGLNMPPDYIERCHRVGKNTNKPRPIIVKFLSHKYKNAVFSAKSKLKETRILIKEDLTKLRFDAMKSLTVTYGFKNVWTYDGGIFYKDGVVVHKNDFYN